MKKMFGVLAMAFTISCTQPVYAEPDDVNVSTKLYMAGKPVTEFIMYKREDMLGPVMPPEPVNPVGFTLECGKDYELITLTVKPTLANVIYSLQVLAGMREND